MDSSTVGPNDFFVKGLLSFTAVYICVLIVATLTWCLLRRQIASSFAKCSSTSRDGHDHALKNDGASRLTIIECGEEPSADFKQQGYKKVLFGTLVCFGWRGVAAISQLSLVSILVRFYFVAEDTSGLPEAFAVILYPSFIVLCIGLSLPLVTELLYLAPCALVEATHVAIQQDEIEPREKICGMSRKLSVVPVHVEIGMRERRWFTYTCVTYLWDDEACRFRPVGSARLVANAISREGLDSASVASLKSQCKNAIEVNVPSIVQSLIAEFSSILYLFNLYCIWVCFIFLYWNGGIVYTILTLTSGSVHALLIVRRQQLKMKSLAEFDNLVSVLRDGKWVRVSSIDLVPRDIIQLGLGIVPCDCVITQGVAVSNEAMLTGEAKPVQKFSIEPSDSVVDLKRHKNNMLFAGTEVLQSSDVECVVSAIGAMTAKGALVRMVLFPCSVRFKFTGELPYAYMALSMYAIVAIALVLTGGPMDLASASFIASFNLMQLANPILPVSLSAGHTVAVKRLQPRGINCLAPPRIAIAGKLHMFIFDKTGTLTETGLHLAAIWPMGDIEWKGGIGQRLEAQDDFLSHAGHLWEAAFASCHALTQISNKIVGSELEAQMFRASGWCFSGQQHRHFEGPTGNRIEILRTLDFDHHQMTSGALARIINKSDNDQTILFLKGSYEKIGSLCIVPNEFAKIATKAASDGFYIIGLAYRSLSDENEVERLRNDAPRSDFETGLKILGLILFQNKLKSSAANVIYQLHRGHVHTVLCSGDNMFTCVAIATECGMVDSGQPVLMGDYDGKKVIWRCGDDVCHLDLRSRPLLAVTGQAYAELTRKGELDELLTHIRVFGRMTPDQKVDVVHKFQNRSLTVGMCGDGGNDCGALRAAHVGVALSEAEASMVAPFSSGSLDAVLHLTTMGRACLATNFACYKFFILSGLAEVTWKVTQTAFGKRFIPEWQLLWMDVVDFGIFTVGMTSCCHDKASLASHRPTASLFSPNTILAVLVLFLLWCCAMGFTEWLLHQQEWYNDASGPFTSHIIASGGLFHLADNYNISSAFLLMVPFRASVAVAYSTGGAFRQPVYVNAFMLAAVLLVSSLWIVLLSTGPTSFTCLFRVNCSNEVSHSAYIPLLSEFSVSASRGCFFGPEAEAWMPRYNITAASPTPCFPTPDLHLDPINGSNGPNNIMSLAWRMLLVGIALFNGIFVVAFINYGLDPLSSFVSSYRKRIPYSSSTHHFFQRLDSTCVASRGHGCEIELQKVHDRPA